MRMRHAALIALMAAGLVAGCKKQPEPQPETNFIEETPEETPPPAPPVEEPAPPPREREPATNVAEALLPEAPVSPDEQMLEDADATGLTARRAAAAENSGDDPVGDLIENEGIR